jgi:nucleotide-binding universal stress UspA family protein
MFQKILVPTDGTPKSERALELVPDLAATDAEVTLLHVIELLDAPMEELEDFYGQLEQRARERLEKLAAPLRETGLTPTQHIRYGKRVAEIVQFAADEEHDLVVLASHRLDPDQPASSWMTISHQVAILAECPVLVVK